MKKLIGIITLIIVIGLCSTAHAEVEFINCNILQTAISSQSFSESVLIKVADTNGKESIFTCDTNIKINGEKYRNAQDIINAIPGGVFGKIGVEDGVAKVILLGGETLEMSVDEFSVSENQLDSNICVINNTKETALFDCIVAIYAKSGELKEICVLPQSVEAYNNVYINPSFEDYKYADDDYAEVYAWEDSEVSPMLDSAALEITQNQ